MVTEKVAINLNYQSVQKSEMWNLWLGQSSQSIWKSSNTPMHKDWSDLSRHLFKR